MGNVPLFLGVTLLSTMVYSIIFVAGRFFLRQVIARNAKLKARPFMMESWSNGELFFIAFLCGISSTIMGMINRH